MDLKKLGQQAKSLVDKRGGSESVKEDASELRDIAKGQGSLADKAKAAVGGDQGPGRRRAADAETPGRAGERAGARAGGGEGRGRRARQARRAQGPRRARASSPPRRRGRRTGRGLTTRGDPVAAKEGAPDPSVSPFAGAASEKDGGA